MGDLVVHSTARCVIIIHCGKMHSFASSVHVLCARICMQCAHADSVYVRVLRNLNLSLVIYRPKVFLQAY